LHSFILILSQNILRNEEKMSSEALLSNIVPIAGSGLLGYMFHSDKNVTTKQNRRSRGGRKFLTLGRNI
jgi:hypothetical protein